MLIVASFDLFMRLIVVVAGVVEGGGPYGHHGLQAEVRVRDAQLTGDEQRWRYACHNSQMSHNHCKFNH